MKILIKFLVTGFYSGFFPYFPGTVGTLLAFFIAWFFKPKILVIFFLSSLGVYLCTQGELIFQKPDSSKIVFDEFCGAFCATWHLSTLPHFILAFIIFRFLDIVKPVPIDQLQALPRGWGVMADDLAAGIMTRLLLAVFIYWG